jgi:hypothetical protein
MAKTTTKEVIAPTRRRLTDLYVVGKELTFDDGTDEPIVVWLSKLSPIQQRDAADSATGARAKLLALKQNPESDPRQVAVFREQLEDLGVKDRDSMIEFLMAPKVQEAYASNEARLADEPAWSDNDYLKSLQTAWNEGLNDKYATDPEDEEAVRVYNELVKFTDQVNEATEEDKENIRLEFTHFSDDELSAKTLERAIDAEADFAWVNEFSRWQVFYAVRDPENHKEQYFLDRSEVDALDAKVLNRLLTEYNEMTADPVEGKD